MSEQVEQAQAAIKRWIIAEWHFRWGPQAYSALAQDAIVSAEENLREVVTGQCGVTAAMESMGYDVTIPERPKRPRRPTPQPTIPSRPTLMA